jgi:Tol biopolymer transport system component
VSPAGAGATKLIDLPFRPARMAGSPDGRRIALLPVPARARIYVYDIARARLTALSFAARGVRRIDGLTWLSSTKILVSATTRSRVTKYPLTDRLYTITTTGRKPVVFRRLRGTEPSAAPGAARLLYVRFRDAGRNPADPRSRMVVEDLMSLKLAPGSKPRVLKHARYPDSFDIRRFRDPDVSPDGRYVVSSTTGSDVSVSYAVRRVASGKLVRAKKTTLGPRARTAWSHGGDRVAFWGMPPSGNMQIAAVYVCDVASGKVTRDGSFSQVAVAGLTWAPDDSLLAFALRARRGGVDDGRLWTIAPGASATPTDLGEGSLPVWLP